MLRQKHILQDVQTLVLDGMSVTADLCYAIINDASYSVRILSIREVRNLNQGKLRAALQYSCRPGRPKNSPRVKALYVFGPQESTRRGIHNSSFGLGWNHKSKPALTWSLAQEGEDWWSKKGRILTRRISPEWVNCMAACAGLIAFDAVLCQGPRHVNSPVFGCPSMPADTAPAVASHALGGCDGCGKAPEGLLAQDASSPFSLPLLTPLPILTSSVQSATRPTQRGLSFVPRCFDCIRERYCTCCNKWWCESCYQLPGHSQDVGMNSFLVLDDDSAASIAQILDMQEAVSKTKVRHGHHLFPMSSSWSGCNG